MRGSTGVTFVFGTAAVGPGRDGGARDVWQAAPEPADGHARAATPNETSRRGPEIAIDPAGARAADGRRPPVAGMAPDGAAATAHPLPPANVVAAAPRPAAPAPPQAAPTPSLLEGAAAQPRLPAAPAQVLPAEPARGHGLVINVTFDPSVSGAPAGFVAAFMDAVEVYESLFNNPITINLDVGWGEIDGQALSGGLLGASMPVMTGNFTYSQVRGALLAGATGLGDQIADTSLPGTDPTGGSAFFMSTAEAEALGLMATGGTAADGWVGFGSGYQYTFDPNERAVPREYDFIGVAEHEIAEVLGRFSGLQVGGGLSPQDLFRYAADGVRGLTPATGTYFSIDGGATPIDTFNFGNGGDLGDWAQGLPPDAYDAFLSAGNEEAVSPGDLLMMSVLGYDPAPQSLSPPPVPTGLALGAGSDSSHGHDVTNVVAPSVTGTGGAGELIILYDGTTMVGEGVVGEGGTWSIASSGLPVGQNLLTAVSSDLFGNESAASAALAVTIKTAAPAPSAPQFPGGGTLTADPMPSLVGSGEAGDTITLFDGGTEVGIGLVGADGSWSVTPTLLPQGLNLLSASETDLAGNVSPVSPVTTLTVAGNVFAGTYALGVVLAYPTVQNPATVTASGTVTGPAGGSGVYGTDAAAWNLVNAGTIAGADFGVALAAGGSIDNTGLIGGVIGIAIIAGAGVGETVVNAGTISGSGGTAIALLGGNERLVADPGAVFNGSVVADGYGALELAAGARPGVLAGLGSFFAGFDALLVDAGAAWQLSGDASAMAVTNDGTITLVGGGTLTLGAVGEDAGARGTIAVDPGAVLVFAAGAAHGQTIDFAGSGGLVRLDEAKGFKARFAGFAAGDTIDLAGSKADGFTYAGGQLTLTEHGRKVATLEFAGHYRAADFQLASDGRGGTEILFAAPDPPFWASSS